MAPNPFSEPTANPKPTVAIVGAGISGLICAWTLVEHGFSITVLEKSRGVGGRMSTRRAPYELRFDHGAQYFTARDPRFREYVQAWTNDGIVAPWLGEIVVVENGAVTERKAGTDRFVAVPGMNAIAKHLARGLDVRLQTQVTEITRQGKQWRLSSEEDDVGHFDVAIISAPALQTGKLLKSAPQLADRANAIEMNGCWALMLAFERPLETAFDGAFVHGSPLSWIARNSSKPGRDTAHETWVAHASPEWSEANLESEPASVQPTLIDEFWRATGTQPAEPIYATAHRWRYAIPPTPLPDECLFDEELKIGACGDWCAGPRVEGAFLSGLALAGSIFRSFENEL